MMLSAFDSTPVRAVGLLLTQSEASPQVSLLLVEEPEAHLHPQMQSSVVAMPDNQATNRRKAQILLTTQSPLLPGSADQVTPPRRLAGCAAYEYVGSTNSFSLSLARFEAPGLKRRCTILLASNL
jgi:hypothetical protein